MTKKKMTTKDLAHPEVEAPEPAVTNEGGEVMEPEFADKLWAAAATPTETLTIRALTSFSMTMPQMRTVAAGETLALPAATAIGLVNAGLAERVK